MKKTILCALFYLSHSYASDGSLIVKSESHFVVPVFIMHVAQEAAQKPNTDISAEDLLGDKINFTFPRRPRYKEIADALRKQTGKDGLLWISYPGKRLPRAVTRDPSLYTKDNGTLAFSPRSTLQFAGRLQSNNNAEDHA